jgi:hypothetical protein
MSQARASHFEPGFIGADGAGGHETTRAIDIRTAAHAWGLHRPLRRECLAISNPLVRTIEHVENVSQCQYFSIRCLHVWIPVARYMFLLDLGVFEGEYRATVPRHSVVLARLIEESPQRPLK